jgi:hypothetical protein
MCNTPWSIKTHQYRFTIGVIPNYTKCVWKLRLYSFPVLSYAIQLYILTNRTTHLPQIPTFKNFKIAFAISDCLRNIFNCVLGVWLADLKWRFAFKFLDSVPWFWLSKFLGKCYYYFFIYTLTNLSRTNFWFQILIFIFDSEKKSGISVSY